MVLMLISDSRVLDVLSVTAVDDIAIGWVITVITALMAKVKLLVFRVCFRQWFLRVCFPKVSLPRVNPIVAILIMLMVMDMVTLTLTVIITTITMMMMMMKTMTIMTAMRVTSPIA
jgi:hypothetical protein